MSAQAEVTEADRTIYYKLYRGDYVPSAMAKEEVRRDLELIAQHRQSAISLATQAQEKELHVALEEMLTDQQREEFGISDDRPIQLCIVRAIANLRRATQEKEAEVERLKGEATTYLMELSRARVSFVSDQARITELEKALQGVIDTCVHPETAVRAVMVDLKPIRAALQSSSELKLDSAACGTTPSSPDSP